jgi:hypothetical protein
VVKTPAAAPAAPVTAAALSACLRETLATPSL